MLAIAIIPPITNEDHPIYKRSVNKIGVNAHEGISVSEKFRN